MATWEYKVLEFRPKVSAGGRTIEAPMNDLGKEGWELIATIPQDDHLIHWLYFRRQKPEKP